MFSETNAVYSALKQMAIGESSLDLPNGVKHLLCELGGA
jgi:hypothetical protein